MAYKEFERVSSVQNVPKLIADIKAKRFRFFSYGNRIYQIFDARGKLARQLIDFHHTKSGAGASYRF